MLETTATSAAPTLIRLHSVPAHTTDMERSDLPKWSGKDPVPAIGQSIHVRINRIGTAKVVGYAIDCGYLGVLAYPLDPPEWWVRQNGPSTPENAALVFGAELQVVQQGA
jgi:hypothetical protein